MIDHIGIAVRSIEEALKTWRLLGYKPGGMEEVASQGVRLTFIQIGETRVELLEPLDESSPIARFLSKRGEGIHHIALKVPDIRKAMAAMAAKGKRCLYETPREGAHGMVINFIHPADNAGVLLELVELQ